MFLKNRIFKNFQNFENFEKTATDFLKNSQSEIFCVRTYLGFRCGSRNGICGCCGRYILGTSGLDIVVVFLFVSSADSSFFLGIALRSSR